MSLTKVAVYRQGFYTKLLRIHEHFPARSAEWGLSYILFSWGCIALLLSAETGRPSLDMPSFTGFSNQHMMFIGACAFVVGATRLVALYINGSSRHTPKARMVCAGFSSLIWLDITWSFVQGYSINGLLHTGFAVYPWFILGDFYASYAAGKDARIAVEINRALHDGTNNGSSDNRFNGTAAC